jgi:hypothetical protein
MGFVADSILNVSANSINGSLHKILNVNPPALFFCFLNIGYMRNGTINSTRLSVNYISLLLFIFNTVIIADFI